MTDLDALRRAWYDEGRAPWYHRHMKAQLRRAWPVLYQAITDLLKENDEQYSRAYERDPRAR
jgi:hypothetical protein